MKNGVRGSSNDAAMLSQIAGMDSYYINKPKRLIILSLFRFYGYFFICSLLSFHILIVPMVPVWVYLLYKFYIALKCLEKFNVSKQKVVVYSFVVIAFEIISSVYIRKVIWLIITRVL